MASKVTPWEVPATDWDNYFSSLGMFHHEFSRMENDMNAILADFVAARIAPDHERSKAILRAATGGMRLAPLRDTMKRVLRACGASAPQQERVSNIFAHVGEIQFVRDRLAHNGATLKPSTGGTVVETDNAFTVSERDKREIITFPISVLSDMTHDSDIAPIVLFTALELNAATDFQAAGADSRYQAALTSERPPWRYKPRELHRQQPR